MSIDVKKLKQQLTLQDYEQIINALDIPITNKSDDVWSLHSGCHHKNSYDGDANLRFYIPTKTFQCYSHHCNVNDIIALVQTRKQLFDSNFDFLDALSFIIDNSSVSIENITRKTPKNTDSINWEQLFDKYLKHENSYAESQIYNESILNFFPKIYHQSWIDDGITIETMEKFGVCYYSYKQQIVIPVHNENGDFIGCHCRNLVQEVVDKGYKYIPLKLLDGTQYKFSTNMVLYGLWENKENIQKTKTAVLLEAPKGVLQMESMLDINNSVGLFGTTLSKYKINLLLQLGVSRFIIALDRQYKRWYNEDDGTEDAKEFFQWHKIVDKMVDDLKPYGNVEVVYDDGDLLDYKQSPSDCGEKTWNELCERRWKI